jgi:hypothetical protein
MSKRKVGGYEISSDEEEEPALPPPKKTKPPYVPVRLSAPDFKHPGASHSQTLSLPSHSQPTSDTPNSQPILARTTSPSSRPASITSHATPGSSTLRTPFSTPHATPNPTVSSTNKTPRLTNRDCECSISARGQKLTMRQMQSTGTTALLSSLVLK